MDALGYRSKFAVLVPSTNTTVQAEFDEMRVRGVTNHLTRISIPNIPLNNDEDFNKLINLIESAQEDAINRVMSCEPDYFVMGISAETFWDGLEASLRLKKQVMDLTGLGVAMGSEACQAALEIYGAKKIAIITPYQPIGDRNVVRFFNECGYDVPRIKGLRCESPVKIAHVQPETLIDEIKKIDGDDIDAIVQVGTNLSMARVAGVAEEYLGKPVIAINSAIYWYALRQNKILDQFDGFGQLFSKN
ncbi:maleate cis-trans isomerase family protein [Marinobacter algicola]|uniref:maleate cis-trans isomerase family protein n=1 Tax=Marinobacter algicola TaxID=236100 RepID=UPI003BADB4A8